LRAYNAAKCDYGAGGAYSAPPDPLASFKGAASRREEEEREGRGRGMEGKGKEGEWQGGRGRGREGIGG